MPQRFHKKSFYDTTKKYGIPSHDIFCRVFGLINKKQLQERVVEALKNNLNLIKHNLHVNDSENEYKHLCIDGKEERGTGRKYQFQENPSLKICTHCTSLILQAKSAWFHKKLTIKQMKSL